MTEHKPKHIVHVRTHLEPNEGWSSHLVEEVEVGSEFWADVQNKRIDTAEEFWRRYFDEKGGGETTGS
jgi:hypothetical protein